MNFRTETLHVWQLTAEEDEAVQSAIRHYLESPQASDAASNRREVVLQGVLQGRCDDARERHPMRTLSIPQMGVTASVPDSVVYGPPIIPAKPQPGAFICPNLRCFVEAPHAQTDPICGSAPPPGPPTMPVVESLPLTDEQKARIAAEAAKVQGHAGGATRLATWEGADK